MSNQNGPSDDQSSRLWLVGQYRGGTGDGNIAWDFQGVFSSQEEAEAACRSADYFVAPATLGAQLPDATCPWPGVYYPKAQ